ncbi:hypothetical protein ACOY97_17815, partial [Enterobacter asburiae]|uniref:hypothetical protein n=1 Tax=Enterobacter asburiae TaxID=61645 RepID=UPI003BCE43D1
HADATYSTHGLILLITSVKNGGITIHLAAKMKQKLQSFPRPKSLIAHAAPVLLAVNIKIHP